MEAFSFSGNVPFPPTHPLYPLAQHVFDSSYSVLVAGFYFAPRDKDFDEFDGSADTVVVGTQFIKAGVEGVKMWLSL